jgi:hypothetical protein
MPTLRQLRYAWALMAELGFEDEGEALQQAGLLGDRILEVCSSREISHLIEWLKDQQRLRRRQKERERSTDECQMELELW